MKLELALILIVLSIFLLSFSSAFLQTKNKGGMFQRAKNIYSQLEDINTSLNYITNQIENNIRMAK